MGSRINLQFYSSKTPRVEGCEALEEEAISFFRDFNGGRQRRQGRRKLMHCGFVREVRLYRVKGGRRQGQCWKSLARSIVVNDRSLKKAKAK